MKKRLRLNICVSLVVTAALIALGVFVFQSSYLRAFEAFCDVISSVKYYFLVLFGSPPSDLPAVTEYSKVISWTAILPPDFVAFKENAEALMNANDELIQRVFGFEEKLTDSNEEMIRQQQDFIKQTKEDMEENQRRIQDQFDALQTALQQMQQSRSFAEPSPVNVPQEDNSASEELPSFDMPVEEELPIIGDMEIEEELPSLDEIEAEEEE